MLYDEFSLYVFCSWLFYIPGFLSGQPFSRKFETMDNQPDNTLPAATTILSLRQRTVYLVGTAHVSRQSVADVATTIERVRPDTICVELCQPRLTTLTDNNSWKKMNIFKVLRDGKAVFLLAQLLMSSFYKRLGSQLGVTPGAEMLEAVRCATNCHAQLVLADRSIETTLKRVWGALSFWNRLDLLGQVIAGLFVREKIDNSTIEKLKEKDQLEAAMQAFASAFPAVKKTLIDERDVYLAEKIRTAPGTTVVAVVGAGHVAGISALITEPHNLAPLESIPPRSLWPTVMKWAIPGLIVGLFIFGFFKGGGPDPAISIYIWIVVNGILAALGAAIAFAHPLTILASFVAAPVTSLNPTIGAGIVAGMVQAWVKKPTVADLEMLSESITTVKGFWGNPVSRILLVVALVSLGSSVGTFISGGWIAARLF